MKGKFRPTKIKKECLQGCNLPIQQYRTEMRLTIFSIIFRNLEINSNNSNWHKKQASTLVMVGQVNLKLTIHKDKPHQ